MRDRLTPLEAIMWRVGQDPTLRMTVGALLLLDQPIKEAELVDRVAAVAGRAPRLQWRPDDPTYARIRPAWVGDEDLDAADHVRVADIAAPGSMRQVLDLLALLEPVPFEPERPPWDVTLIHGLEAGGSALYLRAHHVMTDGLGGVRLMDDLFDRPDRPGREAEPGSSGRRQPDQGDVDDDGEPERDWATVTVDLRRLIQPMSTRVSAAREAQPVETVVRGLQRALDLANSVSRQVLVTGGPLSPVPQAHSVFTHFDVISIADARETARALGGGRTDVLVTAAAAALGLYYERSGESCPKVRVAMPTRQHRNDDAGGNWFAPTRVEVPTSVDHPARRFSIVAERLAQARHEPSLGITAALASAISLLPNRLLLPAIQNQVDSIDLAVTAVPGVHGDKRICGAKVTSAFPLGPRLGAPLNITAFGSNGGLDIGIALDPAAITDPDALRDCLLEVFAKLSP